MTSIERHSVLYAQNFLTNGQLVDRLIDRSSLGPDDMVYEIGPGTGIITERLALRCRRVVAVEKDPPLATRLQRVYAASHNVTVHAADFLRYALPDTPYKVFSSIPFNVTTAIITKLTTAARPPDDAYLVVQREAAAKFLGWPRESLYAVLMKPWFEPSLVYRFHRTDFTPAPNVEVAMLRLRKRGPPLVSKRDRQFFRDFVVYGFSAWQPSLRMTLRSILSARQLALIGEHAGIDLDVTPSSVRFEEWLHLFHLFKSAGNAHARTLIMGSEQRLRAQQAGLRKMHRTRVRRDRSAHAHQCASRTHTRDIPTVISDSG